MLFSATHSYAVGKSFQVILLLCVVLVVARLLTGLSLGKNLVANFWLIFILFINRNLMYQAGLAYIDVGAAASVVLVTITAWLWIKKPTLLGFLLFIFSVGSSMGIKYSTLPSIMANIVLMVCARIKDWRILTKLSLVKWLQLLIIIFCAWFAMGGYWYIKNLLISGNPFWPFFNKLLGIDACCDGQMIIEGWGYIPFKLENKWLILDGVFGKRLIQWWVRAVTVLVLGFVFKIKHFASFVMFYLFLIVVVLIEILLNLRSGLFTPRFYLHWQFYKYLFLVLPLGVLSVSVNFNLAQFRKRLEEIFIKDIYFPKRDLLIIGIGLFWFVSLGLLIKSSLPDGILQKNVNLEEIGFNDNDRLVVSQKMKVLDWVHPFMPYSFPMIEWCSPLVDGEQTIFTADHETIIGKHGLSRLYLVRCLIKEVIPLTKEAPQQTVQRYVQAQPDLIYFSSTNCIQSQANDLSGLNTAFVCAGEEFKPQLYRFPQN